MIQLTCVQAGEAYDILAEHAGAPVGHDKQSFIYEFSGDAPTREWRFCGSLGFGGKFRFPRMTVDCYPEDKTPERLKAIEVTNAHLAELKAKWTRAGEGAAGANGAADAAVTTDQVE